MKKRGRKPKVRTFWDRYSKNALKWYSADIILEDAKYKHQPFGVSYDVGAAAIADTLYLKPEQIIKPAYKWYDPRGWF